MTKSIHYLTRHIPEELTLTDIEGTKCKTYWGYVYWKEYLNGELIGIQEYNGGVITDINDKDEWPLAKQYKFTCGGCDTCNPFRNNHG